MYKHRSQRRGASSDGTSGRSSEDGTARSATVPVYINVAEVAELLGVKECYIRRLVAEHRIPHHKLGKYLRFDRDEVLDWMAANRVEPLR